MVILRTDARSDVKQESDIMGAPKLKTFRLWNFKAIKDSGTIQLTPLTVLIGNNGSGQSSLIEGLETLQSIVNDGLDKAMQQWRGFEHIWYKRAALPWQETQSGAISASVQGKSGISTAMRFDLKGRIDRGPFTAALELNTDPEGSKIFIQDGRVSVNNNEVEVLINPDEVRIRKRPPDDTSESLASGGNRGTTALSPEVDIRAPINGRERVTDSLGELEFGRALDGFISQWQFLSLIPQQMGSPTPQKRTAGPARLEKDGSNIAGYLAEILQMDERAFRDIIDTLKFVLPYADDLETLKTSEVERAIYLQLAEGEFKVPGWLLSTGTLRVLAILALLRHPQPPPLIVIEELENGLDPRSVHLIIEEIRNAVERGEIQIIATTHSPYLLDLLSLEHIILVERKDGTPLFSRPADNDSLQQWARTFSPGQLFTMDRLRGEIAS